MNREKVSILKVRNRKLQKKTLSWKFEFFKQNFVSTERTKKEGNGVQFGQNWLHFSFTNCFQNKLQFKRSHTKRFIILSSLSIHFQCLLLSLSLYTCLSSCFYVSRHLNVAVFVCLSLSLPLVFCLWIYFIFVTLLLSDTISLFLFLLWSLSMFCLALSLVLLS